MHFNFDFSAVQILWTLTFAGQLVLLVVLLGRNHARRYPWFTAGIALFALGLMAEKLLGGRMAMLPFQETLLTIGALTTIVGLLVQAEMAWQAFARAPRSLLLTNGTGLLLVAGGIVYAWGRPWPAMSAIALDTLLGKLRLIQLISQKGDILVALLAVGVLMLVLIFGRRYQAGWRSYTQMIVIGLAAVGLSSLALQIAAQAIIHAAQPHTRAEADHIREIFTRLMNANQAIYVVALVWWIVWLWLDEPGAADTDTIEPDTSEPIQIESPTAE